MNLRERQFPEAIAEQLVERTGIDHIAGERLSVKQNLPALEIEREKVARILIQLNSDQRMCEHPLEHRRVTLARKGLMGFLEIAVVVGDVDGHAGGDRFKIQVLGPVAPLLHGVVEVDVVEDELAQLAQPFVLMPAQDGDRHLHVRSEGVNEKPAQFLMAVGQQSL